MELKVLLNDLEYQTINDFINLDIEKICYDSRKIVPNSLFTALKGTQSDGHLFIDKAIQNGAKVIVCEDFPASLKQDIVYVQVKNSRHALAQISHNFFGNPTNKIDVYAVTGTNGKTTITFLLNSVFQQAYYNSGIIGTTGIYINNKFQPATHTTPESLELAEIFKNMLDANLDKVAIETSSHALDQHRADCIDFRVALFTNLTHEHLDYHKTLENYAKAKKILFDNLNPKGLAIAFDNSEFSEYMLSGVKSDRKYLLGRNTSDDIIIFNERLGLNNSSFNIRFQRRIPKIYHGEYLVASPLIGRFNIDNLALAFSAAYLNDIDSHTIINALKTAKGAPGRMQRFCLNNGAIAIVDYAHTPDALENALVAAREVLKHENNPAAKLICVFGCGGDRDRTKRPIMGEIAARLSDFFFVTDDNPRTESSNDIINEILTGIQHDFADKYEVIENRKDAIAQALKHSNNGDIILIAGKGHENYQIIGTEKHHFDDCEEVKKFGVIK